MSGKRENQKCNQTGQDSEQDNRQELGQPVREDTNTENNPPPINGRTSFGNQALKWLPTIAVGAAVGIVGTVAAPVVASAALGAAGFTTSGVAAGSAAAAIQSTFYGGYVASGSTFALLQSAGAAGISATTSGVIGGSSGVGAAIGTRWFRNRRSSDITKLLICGSGNGAHAFAGIASSLKGTDVRVLSVYQDEAERWSAAMQKKELEVTLHRKGKEPSYIVSKPALVTKNPEDAVRDVDIVVFFLPAFECRGYLEALQPHITAGTIIAGLPGHPGFEFQARDLLGDTGRQCTIMNFESSPWECRITEFGVKCEVHHTKETLVGTMKKGDVPPKKDPVPTLQYLLGALPKLMVSDRP